MSEVRFGPPDKTAERANDAFNMRSDKAKYTLYERVDAPVVQMFHETIVENPDSAPNRPLPQSHYDVQSRHSLFIVDHNEPRVYSFFGHDLDGPQVRGLLLGAQDYWFERCLRCEHSLSSHPVDHKWQGCKDCCFFCLSFAHVGEPCPGPFRRSINHVRYVIALEPPGPEWYERNVRPKTPPRSLAPVVEARSDKTAHDADVGHEERKKPVVISLLSSSPSSNGKGHGDTLEEESKLTLKDEELVKQEDQPRPHDLGAPESFYSGAEQQELGIDSQLGHGGKTWDLDQLEAHHANQRDIEAYFADGEEEYQDRQEGYDGHGETAFERLPQPYNLESSWTFHGDLRWQSRGATSRFLPAREVAQSIERDPVMQVGSQEHDVMDLTSEGPESPQTVICVTDRREDTGEEYDEHYNAERYFSDVEMEDENETENDEEEEGERTEYEEKEDEEMDFQMDEDEDVLETANVIDLASSSPPAEDKSKQGDTVEPQAFLQDDNGASHQGQGPLEGTGCQPLVVTFDGLPTAERYNQEGAQGASGPVILSSDTIMPDDSDMFEAPSSPSILEEVQKIGPIARDFLSPVRSRSEFLQDGWPDPDNDDTSHMGHEETGRQNTTEAFHFARDSPSSARSHGEFLRIWPPAPDDNGVSHMGHVEPEKQETAQPFASAREPLSPLRSYSGSAALGNQGTNHMDHDEPGQQETDFGFARDSLSLYPETRDHWLAHGFVCTRSNANQKKEISEGLSTVLSTPSGAPDDLPPPDHAMDSHTSVKSDPATRENTPLDGMDLIQLQLEVEHQKAVAENHKKQHTQSKLLSTLVNSALLVYEGADAPTVNVATQGNGPIDGMDAAQLQLQQKYQGACEDMHHSLLSAQKETTHEDVYDDGNCDSNEASETAEPVDKDAVDAESNDLDEELRIPYHEDSLGSHSSSVSRSDEDSGDSQGSEDSGNDDKERQNSEDYPEHGDTEMEEDEDSDSAKPLDSLLSPTALTRGYVEQQPPSPTPTELHQQQLDIDFAQRCLRRLSSLTPSDQEDEEKPTLESCYSLLPCGPPSRIEQANQVSVPATPNVCNNTNNAVTSTSYNDREQHQAREVSVPDAASYSNAQPGEADLEAQEQQRHASEPMPGLGNRHGRSRCCGELDEQHQHLRGETRARTRSRSPEQCGVPSSHGGVDESTYRQR